MSLEDSYVNVEEEVLHCPRCHSTGGGNLHHTGVIVYQRNEDEETTLVTVVAPNGESCSERMPSDLSGNPSTRRDGVAIVFTCEQCGDGLRLTIAQHKGDTLVNWLVRPDDMAPSWHSSTKTNVTKPARLVAVE